MRLKDVLDARFSRWFFKEPRLQPGDIVIVRERHSHPERYSNYAWKAKLDRKTGSNWIGHLVGKVDVLREEIIKNEGDPMFIDPILDSVKLWRPK